MEQKPNKYIIASYKLYDVTDGESRLLEETTPDRPFIFISGMGVVLPKFEEKLVELDAGDSFEFVLSPEEAYGERIEERVITVDRENFCENGHFDHEHVFVGADIPLQNADGNRFYGKVLEITDDNVKIDLNLPLAGMTLRFTGEVTEAREATIEEMAHLANLLGGGCDCGGDCECGCGHDHGEGGHCGGHHHEHGEGGCCGGHGHDHGEGHCCHHHGKED